MNQPQQLIHVDDIYDEIVRKWNGYEPNKKSISITLSVWTKEGKVQKNEENKTYMWIV